MNYEVEKVNVIEYHMLDKRKYFPLTFASGLAIRSTLYPIMLIKTRLQIQKGNTVYKGTFDALFKIGANEGVSGLYRGFWVSCLQLVPSMAYITTYETIRHKMADRGITDNSVRSFVSGGCASIVGQTLAVPVDITSQHLMLMGRRDTESSKKKDTMEKAAERNRAQQKLSSLQHIYVSEEDRKSRFGGVRAVVRSVYQQNGVLGFYKGYFVSLACFAPHSALWWSFYGYYCGGEYAQQNEVLFGSLQHIYVSEEDRKSWFGLACFALHSALWWSFFYGYNCDILPTFLPVSVPHLAIQTIAAPMGSVTSALITNPIDVIRARIQVEGTKFNETVRLLWKEEGMWIMTKGLSARIIQSVTFSFFVMLGYETVKRWSVLEEYKDQVRW